MVSSSSCSFVTSSAVLRSYRERIMTRNVSKMNANQESIIVQETTFEIAPGIYFYEVGGSSTTIFLLQL